MLQVMLKTWLKREILFWFIPRQSFEYVCPEHTCLFFLLFSLFRTLISLLIHIGIEFRLSSRELSFPSFDPNWQLSGSAKVLTRSWTWIPLANSWFCFLIFAISACNTSWMIGRTTLWFDMKENLSDFLSWRSKLLMPKIALPKWNFEIGCNL